MLIGGVWEHMEEVMGGTGVGSSSSTPAVFSLPPGLEYHVFLSHYQGHFVSRAILGASGRGGQVVVEGWSGRGVGWCGCGVRLGDRVCVEGGV